MNGKWSRIVLSLMVFFAALIASKLAFASPVAPAPEIDPRLAIEGLALAGAGAALVLERIRRRNK
jgi:hypothetical protein